MATETGRAMGTVAIVEATAIATGARGITAMKAITAADAGERARSLV